jgi:hypothetical protein
MTVKRIPAEKPHDAAASVDLDRLYEAAVADMTPKERYAAELGRQQLEELRVQNRIAAAGERRETRAVDAMVEEKVLLADEQHKAIAAGRRAARVKLETAFQLDRVQGMPLATVRVLALGEIRGDAEKHAGEFFVNSLSGWEMAEAEAILLKDTMEPFQQQIDELVMNGHTDVAAKLKAACLSNGHIVAGSAENPMSTGIMGLGGRRWKELTQPTIRRLVTRKPLSELIASGACKQVGQIEVSDQPIRTALEPA